jgi:hypothetical protein
LRFGVLAPKPGYAEQSMSPDRDIPPTPENSAKRPLTTIIQVERRPQGGSISSRASKKEPGKRPYLAHVELQAARDPNIATRMLNYRVDMDPVHAHSGDRRFVRSCFGLECVEDESPSGSFKRPGRTVTVRIRPAIRFC